MKKQYVALKQAFDDYVAGGLSADALKPVAAPFGIYQQRNGDFMVRVRVTGGEITCDKLTGLAGICEAAAGRAHLTSRQAIQLHDIPAAHVAATVQACDRLGLPFRGGGGNTYRNTVVGADSGLSPEGAFDVYPYAHALNRALVRYEKAFALPRKFKLGFFAGTRDLLRAATHDLGFVAQVRDGRRGFIVYAGGGMGRESAVGVRLTDFLPAEQALRAAVALIALFHDHGDRANRNQARLRFVLKRLGPEAFQRLYLEYYAAAKAPLLRVAEAAPGLPPEFAACAARFGVAEIAVAADGFAHWERFAVLPTRFGDAAVSVRLFVPYGNLTAGQLRRVAALATEFGAPRVRLLPTQDMLLPYVPRVSLRALYARLQSDLPDLDLTFASYKGHLVTCIGASVCKIGMVDAPAVADALAAELDRYLPADTEAKLALLRTSADGLRISGCPNACSGHPAACIGIGCLNQKVDGDIRPFGRVVTGAGVVDGVPQLSTSGGDEPARPVPALVAAVLERLRTAASIA